MLSDEPRGPHPISQFNVIFETPEFQKIVPWLMLNREGLDVLVHPLTESSYDDHSKNALWLGTPVPMRLDNPAADLQPGPAAGGAAGGSRSTPLSALGEREAGAKRRQGEVGLRRRLWNPSPHPSLLRPRGRRRSLDRS